MVTPVPISNTAVKHLYGENSLGNDNKSPVILEFLTETLFLCYTIAMNFNKLKNRDVSHLDHPYFQQYSISIPFIKRDNEYFLLFEKRAASLKVQPGEICFPGGRKEDGESFLQTALRETCEELFVEPHDIQVLGQADTCLTPFNSEIHAFFIEIHNYANTFNAAEVESVILVSISDLLVIKPMRIFNSVHNQPHPDFPFEKAKIPLDYNFKQGSYPVYFYDIGEQVIWGITAKFLKHTIDLLR